MGKHVFYIIAFVLGAAAALAAVAYVAWAIVQQTKTN